MNRIGRNISTILRMERLLARRQMTVLRNQTGVLVFAALVGAIGLVMLNIAAFYWLRLLWSAPLAALAVGVANLVLAALMVAIALRMTGTAGLEPVTELRDLAVGDLEAEVDAVVDDLRDVADNVRRMARDPIGMALPALAGPLVATVIKTLRKDENDAI